MSLFERVRDFLIEPLSEAECEQTVRESGEGSELSHNIALLCAPQRALALGSSLALGLVRQQHSSHALLCLWGIEGPLTGGLAARAVRRRAERVALSGPETKVRGRLIHTLLAPDTCRAVSEAERAIAAAAGPSVTVIAGPRDRQLDRLLAQQDLIVVAADAGSDDELLREVTLRSLSYLEVPVISWQARIGPVTRLLATAGLTVGGMPARRLTHELQRPLVSELAR